MSELFNTIPDNQFEGGSNLTEGSRKGPEGDRSGETLVDWMRRIKSGSETFTGAGNSDIVFATPYPSTSFQILLSTNTVAVTPIWANKVVTGFRITAAAAGIVDWMTVYNGPSA